MPQTPHIERHFTGSEVIRDIVIGMSDELTVPFALAAGLSDAVASARIVVTAGLAEVAAGSIAMGLGGYLAAKSDAEHFESEHLREETEVRAVPETETGEVQQILQSYGLTVEETVPVVNASASDLTLLDPALPWKNSNRTPPLPRPSFASCRPGSAEQDLSGL
jgi:VIT1/CCC1 family predicted Fe2+/Mn2+ transporter